MHLGTRVKIGIAVAATVVVLMFGEMNPSALLAIIIGALLMVLGIYSLYRPAAVIGAMLAIIGAGVAVSVNSVTDVGSLLTAVLGLFVPVYVVMSCALWSEDEEGTELAPRRRPTVQAAGFAVVTLMSVPLVSLVLGVFFPAISIHMSIMSEAAIMLLATACGVIVMTGRVPRTAVPTVEEAATE